VHKLPGQVQLMRGLFILGIQKHGFQSKEVHFDLYPCFHQGQLPPKPAPNPPPKPPAQNSTPQPPATPPPKPPPHVPLPHQAPPNNSTANASAGGDGPSTGHPVCPGIGLLSAGFLSLWLVTGPKHVSK